MTSRSRNSAKSRTPSASLFSAAELEQKSPTDQQQRATGNRKPKRARKQAEAEKPPEITVPAIHPNYRLPVAPTKLPPSPELTAAMERLKPGTIVRMTKTVAIVTGHTFREGMVMAVQRVFETSAGLRANIRSGNSPDGRHGISHAPLDCFEVVEGAADEGVGVPSAVVDAESIDETEFPEWL